MKDRVGEIKLRMQCGGTRSGSATAVTAYINDDIITVETANYAGDSVLIEIFDGDGILQTSSHFDYTDYCVVDISSLPPGKHEIVITLDYGYRGSFVK